MGEGWIYTLRLKGRLPQHVSTPYLENFPPRTGFEGAALTVGMPHVHAGERHLGWAERVIAWEFQLGGENATFEGSVFGTLDDGFPVEEVVFADGAGGDAIRGVGAEEAVFVEEALLGDGLRHVRGGVARARIGRRRVRDGAAVFLISWDKLTVC